MTKIQYDEFMKNLETMVANVDKTDKVTIKILTGIKSCYCVRLGKRYPLKFVILYICKKKTFEIHIPTWITRDTSQYKRDLPKRYEDIKPEDMSFIDYMIKHAELVVDDGEEGYDKYL